MTTRAEAIDAAILAHERWKQWLEQAAESGQTDLDPAVVGQDDQCTFGRWLHDELPDADRVNPIYERVALYHASFHQAAGHIVALVLQKERIKVSVALGLTGAFAKRSALLLSVLREWRATP